MEATKDAVVVDTKSHEDSSDKAPFDSGTIYIDPQKEKAALRKFDKLFLPMAFVFLILSSLDRTNVSEALGFHNPLKVY